jgi:bleomycin hydrolase
MTNVLTDKVKYYVKDGYGNMTCEGYRKAIEDILYKYMGKVPESFNYEGKKYSAKSFAEERIGINPDDYIEITSYSHHPFYSKFILEMLGNWNYNYYLNLPINDFIKVIDNALLKNYSLCWDGDIREGYKDGFSLLKKDTVITQALRQRAFDNYTTQDIHNMHIIGMAENNKGQRFYIIKNSSDYNNCGGYMYMSREYLLLKTISVMVHKDAIPKDIKNKLPHALL